MPDNLWALVEPLLASPVGVAPLMPVVGARRMVWPHRFVIWVLAAQGRDVATDGYWPPA